MQRVSGNFGQMFRDGHRCQHLAWQTSRMPQKKARRGRFGNILQDTVTEITSHFQLDLEWISFRRGLFYKVLKSLKLLDVTLSAPPCDAHSVIFMCNCCSLGYCSYAVSFIFHNWPLFLLKDVAQEMVHLYSISESISAFGPTFLLPFSSHFPPSFPFRPCPTLPPLLPSSPPPYPPFFDSRKLRFRYPSVLGTLALPMESH